MHAGGGTAGSGAKARGGNATGAALGDDGKHGGGASDAAHSGVGGETDESAARKGDADMAAGSGEACRGIVPRPRVCGYARVSSREQNLDRQLAALAEFGVAESGVSAGK